MSIITITSNSVVTITSGSSAACNTVAAAAESEGWFRKEPGGRGTIGLLWGCSLTFGLCIWASVFPNILPGSTDAARRSYKYVWMILAALFPEIIMLCAFGQWRAARRLHAFWLKKYPVTEETPDIMGIEGGFFLLMGGFFVRECDSYISIITPLGFEHYTRLGNIKYGSFDKKFINDKGKASAMVTFLVLLQSSWFSFQCLSRVRDRLPVTLLEVHVATQVVCMLVIVLFWWNKPFDVNESIFIDLGPPFMPVVEEKSGGVVATPASVRSNNSDAIEAIPGQNPFESPQDAQTETTQELNESSAFSREYIITEQPRPGFPNLVLRGMYDVAEYIVNRSNSKHRSRDDGGDESGGGDDNASDRHCEAEGEDDDEIKYKGFRDMAMLGVLLAFNGLLHLVAWNANFPATTERWLWRTSCFTVCFTSIVFTIMVAVTDYDKRFLRALWETRFHNTQVYGRMMSRVSKGRKDIFRAWENQVVTWQQQYIRGLGVLRWPLYWMQRILFDIFWAVVFVYLICTVYLTLESIISFRAPPKQTWKTSPPTNGSYWPHIG